MLGQRGQTEATLAVMETYLHGRIPCYCVVVVIVIRMYGFHGNKLVVLGFLSPLG